MKRLKNIVTEQVQMEVVECDCGYHMGIDATYLDQVDDFIAPCPSCNALINTSKYCSEDDECLVDSDGCLIDNDGDAETDMEDRR